MDDRGVTVLNVFPKQRGYTIYTAIWTRHVIAIFDQEMFCQLHAATQRLGLDRYSALFVREIRQLFRYRPLAGRRYFSILFCTTFTESFTPFSRCITIHSNRTTSFILKGANFGQRSTGNGFDPNVYARCSNTEMRTDKVFFTFDITWSLFFTMYISPRFKCSSYQLF